MLSAHDYEIIDRALQDVRAPVTPASAQGMLSGMRVIDEGLQAAPWMAWVLEGTEPRGEPAQRVLAGLTRLFLETPGGAEIDIERFHLLLPGDEHPLSHRCLALAEWCDGFLFGLGNQGGVPPDLLEGEPGEALQALSAIARLDPDGESHGTGDDEEHFVELVEFVRVAALLLASSSPTTVRPAHRSQPGSGNEHDDISGADHGT